MEEHNVEDSIREHSRAERWQAAATLWIEHHGPEILTFLAAMGGSKLDPDELFSQFCEDVWRGLPGFRWDCSTRTWSYRLARNAWVRALKKSSRRGRAIPLSEASALSRAAQHARSSTAIHLRTEVKDEFAALREELSQEDQMLLVLRVDRGLPWGDAARVLAEEGDLSDADASAAIPRLRKRFQRIKERLRKLAVERGLVPSEG
jgi:RNA polymerase sigma-70 factor (ECF subfamily)